MQIFDITIAVNGSRPLEAVGTYFYYYDGSAGGADATVVLKEDTGGSTVVLKPGQAFRLPDGVKPATRWYIANFANQATITGRVVIGSGEITDNRVTGSVEIIDGGLNRTRANLAFFASPSIGGVGGTVAEGQLWNPVGTGKNLVITKMVASLGAVGQLNFGSNVVALGTPYAAPKSKLANSGVASVGLSKVANSGASSIVDLFGSLILPAGQSQIIQFNEPVVIPPGTGFVMTNLTLAASLITTLEFFETSTS